MRGALIEPDPTYQKLPYVSISPYSWLSIGAYLSAMALSGQTSTAWPTANLALLVPFSTWQTLTIKEVFWITGATAGGNVDVGIYDSIAVNLLASLGSTSRGTATFPNTSTTWTDFVLVPGDYYMALSLDGTNTINSPTTPAAGLLAATGILEATSAFPLPSTITPVATTRSIMPYFGLLMDSTAI